MAHNIPTEWIVKIEFGATRSKSYQQAVSLAKSLPHFSQVNGVTICGIKEIKEYIMYHERVHSLIFMVEKWKTARIIFYDQLYDTKVAGYHAFRERAKMEAGKYACLLMNWDITMEDVPLPIVFYPDYYGAFFGFAKDIGEKIYFCECERTAIANYIQLRTLFPLKHYSGSKTYPLGSDYFPMTVAELSTKRSDDPLSLFGFMSNICFRCNHKTPEIPYCDRMYGSGFKLTHGWYVNQKYFEFGIDPYQINSDKILREYCPPDLYHNIQCLEELRRQEEIRPNDIELTNEIKIYEKEISDFIKNAVRVESGFKPKEDIWVNETLLYNIIKGLYPKHKIIRHYRPTWLEGLELDIFIPELKLAFEYQGIQHFEPVEHWGGNAQLKKQQKNDAKKLSICNKLNVNLIYFYYYDELTSELVGKRIFNSCL